VRSSSYNSKAASNADFKTGEYDVISYREYERLEDIVWSAAPVAQLSTENELIWWLAEHLSAYIEMIVVPDVFEEVDPAALDLLMLTEEHLLKLGIPRPRALAWYLSQVTGQMPRGA
jgi:hypothetical protein